MEYMHYQTSASNTWNITHNLGTEQVVIGVIIDYLGSKQNILPGNIEIISENEVSVSFTNAHTGEARIIKDGK